MTVCAKKPYVASGALDPLLGIVLIAALFIGMEKKEVVSRQLVVSATFS